MTARRLTFHLILHTHWDREWYLPRASFVPRLVATVRDVLDLLESDGAARFVLDGQTVITRDVLDIEPEWRERIAGHVVAGRLEVGPWYVLADELVPSGESLVRNLLLGQLDAASLGRRMDVLYSPDAFGHPSVLPALAHEFGIHNAVTWRGLGTAREDRDLWRWRGPGDAEVLVYHLPRSGYGIGAELAAEPEHAGRRWRAIREELVARAATTHVAVFVGADHHAPPINAGDVRDLLQHLEPGHDVALSSLAEYFAAVRSEVSGIDGLATIDGELRSSPGYVWSLQGTHGTRTRLKRRHGAVELGWQRKAEVLAALAELAGATGQRGLLRSGWRTLVECQFHDTICGCCNDLVAREQEYRLTAVQALSSELVRSSLHALARHDPDTSRNDSSRINPTLLVWNPAARTRGGIVTASVTWFTGDVPVGPPSGQVARISNGARPFVLVTDAGVQVPVQVLAVDQGTERVDARRHYPDQDRVDRVLVAFEAPPIWGLGLTGLSVRESDMVPAPTDLQAHAGTIVNRQLEVRAAADGRIDLTDRRTGEHYPDILQLVDEPDLGDTYTPSIRQVRAVQPRFDAVTTLATGPLVAALAIPFTLPSGTGFVRGRIVLVSCADSATLRVRLEVFNAAVDHRLRLRIPVNAGEMAMAGAAFGYERRAPIEPTQDPGVEASLTTAPAHRFVAAGHGLRGIAITGPGFFEYEWNHARDLLLTVFRSTGELSRASLPERPGHAGWPMPTPEAQEPGSHIMEFGITPFGDPDLSGVPLLEQLWEETTLPLQPLFVRDFAGVPEAWQKTGVMLEGAGLIFSSLKPAESGAGLVLRCYNATETRVDGRVIVRTGLSGADRLRADESRLAELPVVDGVAVDFHADPRAIVTLLLKPGRS